jgi:hypothetical protein
MNLQPPSTVRLNALARSYARLGRGTRKSAGLTELVEDELAPHRSETNVSVEGPDLPLIPERAQALTMVLHELWRVAGESSSAQLNLVWHLHCPVLDFIYHEPGARRGIPTAPALHSPLTALRGLR